MTDKMEGGQVDGLKPVKESPEISEREFLTRARDGLNYVLLYVDDGHATVGDLKKKLNEDSKSMIKKATYPTPSERVNDPYLRGKMETWSHNTKGELSYKNIESALAQMLGFRDEMPISEFKTIIEQRYKVAIDKLWALNHKAETS